MKRFYQVTGFQIFMASIFVGVTAAALVIINMQVREYLMMPVVVQSPDGKCAAVENYRNGDAYACGDVGVVLRNYRIRKAE